MQKHPSCGCFCVVAALRAGQLAVVVAMARVRMVQMTGDEIVGVVAVRHRFVATAVTMLVASLVVAASMIGRAVSGIRRRYRHGMVIDMALMLMMQVPVVQIIDMTLVRYGRVAAIRAVLVTVVVVDMMGVSHLLSPRFGSEVKVLVGPAGQQMIDMMMLGTTLRRRFQLHGDVLDAEVMGSDVPQASPQFRHIALKRGIDKDVGGEYVVAGR